MKRVVIALVGILILIGLTSIVVLNNRRESTQEQPQPTIPDSQDSTVDQSASFAIFTNGLKRNFTAAMYHNLSDAAYIQADNPNIIHVKKQGVTWGDFFDTLPFKLTQECLTTGTGQTFCSDESGTLKFYLNGKRVNNLLEKEIQDGDAALITYGSENEAQIQKQLEQVISPE